MGNGIQKEPGKLTPEHIKASEDRAEELRHLQAKIEATGLDWLRVGITGDPYLSNCFGVWCGYDDDEPDVLGEGLSFTRAGGFIEGVIAAERLFRSWPDY